MPRIVAVLVGALFALGGCAGAPGADSSAASIDNIVVGHDATGSPTIEYPAGGNFTQAQSRVEWEGTGERLTEGDPVLLDLYSVSLTTGAILTDTYLDLPQAFLVAPELLGNDLYGAIVGHKVGTRVLLVVPESPTHPGQGTVAVVADVLPERAIGVTQPARADLPIVIDGKYGEPTVTFRDDVEVPTDLVAYTLIQGGGPQIKTGSRILLNYQETSATTREVVQSTWPVEIAPWAVTIGQGEVPTGLEQSLIDVNEGSQIIVIVPPALAYGDDTLIFVVDVLAVRNPG
ncbi:MAG TPA: FKBP-type peptidyl-prolyl cis-trans isomerase [Demequinaceae bacterium]